MGSRSRAPGLVRGSRGDPDQHVAGRSRPAPRRGHRPRRRPPPRRRRRRTVRGGGIVDRHRRSTGRGPLAPAADGHRGTERPNISRFVDRILRETCEALFATDRDGRWQADALDRIFDDVLESATVGGEASATPLDFVDVRRLIDERLESLPGRPDYFRGGITVSSLTPLRWIPFRVVCLLGMDQPAFGSMSAPGDDLAAASPELGDPDPRAEMRQSLLEAVLAAGDHLIVLRDGHDVRTNQEIPRLGGRGRALRRGDLAGRYRPPTRAGRPTRDRPSPPVVRPTMLRGGRPRPRGAVGLRHQEPGRSPGPSRPGPDGGRPSCRHHSDRSTTASSSWTSCAGSSGIPPPSSWVNVSGRACPRPRKSLRRSSRWS